METQEIKIKVCIVPGCEKTCQPLPVAPCLQASEWYCPHCHKSYRMEPVVAQAILNYEAQMRGAGRGKEG